MINGFLPTTGFEHDLGQTMPLGWEEMDWGFLDHPGRSLDSKVHEHGYPVTTVDDGDLTLQERDHL
jgi:hypothetical protein